MASTPYGEGPSGLLMHHDTLGGAGGTVGQYVDVLVRKVLDSLRAPGLLMDKDMASFVKEYLVSLKLDYEHAVAQGWLEDLPELIGEFRSLADEVESRARRPFPLAA